MAGFITPAIFLNSSLQIIEIKSFLLLLQRTPSKPPQICLYKTPILEEPFASDMRPIEREGLGFPRFTPLTPTRKEGKAGGSVQR